MRKSSIAKYRAIQQRYNELYKQGLRTDVIIPRLQKEYFFDHPESVWRILRIDLPEPEPANAAA